MLKKIFALSICLYSAFSSINAQAANYWWETDVNTLGSSSQSYKCQEEKTAFTYAKNASQNTSLVKVNTWYHDNYREGPNTAYALVRTQNNMSSQCGAFEKQTNTYQAQSKMMQDNNLYDEDLMNYVLLLSILDK